MSDPSDLERDVAEEDELRALLRGGDRDLAAPSFAVIERRLRGSRVAPAFSGIAVATLAIALGVGFATWRAGAPATSPSPSLAPTAPPQVATPQVAPTAARVAPPGDIAPALCPEPPRPGYLPWPSSQTQMETTPTAITTTWFGPGSGPSQARVRIAIQPYADAQPATRALTAGARQVHVYFTWELSSGAVQVIPGQPAPTPGLTVRQAGEARAWWREPSGACPVVTVALVWPEKDSATQEAELLRVVASIPAIAVSPALTARPAAGYGVLSRQPDGRMKLLREQDASVVASLDEPSAATAVSADAREVAYWGGTDGRELWVARARDLGQRRKLLTLENERGAGIVWSLDGTSLMVAAASTTFGPGPLAAPTYTALRVIGRDGSAVRELARIETGQFVRPLAWDPARDLGAAQEGLGQKGPGRYILVSSRPLVIEGPKTSNVRFMDLPDARDAGVVVRPLQASSDARFVMATWSYGGRELIRFWPLEGLDFGRMRELVPEKAAETLLGAVWRPRSLEIGVNVAGHFQVWTLDGQRRRVRDLGGSTTALWFRYDGTALYSADTSGGRVELTDLTSVPPRSRELPGALGAIIGSVDLTDAR